MDEILREKFIHEKNFYYVEYVLFAYKYLLIFALSNVYD